MAIEEVLLLAKILQTAYSAYQTVLSWASAPDPASVRELYNRIVSLEVDVTTLTRGVESATYELRRSEAIAITRAVDAQRSAYLTAWQYSFEHPGDPASELTALTAAMALANPSFYTFAGRTAGSPDRFDPRAALPSFIEATNTWMALRVVNGSLATDTSRNALTFLASRLADIVGRMRMGVVALETYSSYDRPVVRPPMPPRIPRRINPDDPLPDPIPEPTEPRCHHHIVCVDSMRELMEYTLTDDTPAYCSVPNGTFLNAPTAKSYLDAYYMPDRLDAIAQGWRARAAR